MAKSRSSKGHAAQTSWWQRHFGNSTRGRVAALLRRATLSVEELASAIGVTDNAVRAQLTALERDGVVRQSGVRRDGGVGKPATLYELAPAAATTFSAAYAPMLAAVLAEARDRLTPSQLRALLRGAGHRLASDAASGAAGTFDERVNAACGLLAELGADAELRKTGDGYEIAGFGCPLGAAVEQCPETCRAVEQLLADVTGGHVREACNHGDPPRCAFHITAAKRS